MSKAVIQWIGGPVLKARVADPFHIHEALAVGAQRLLGEVIQLSGDTITAQVYEDTTGLKPGDPVEGTGLPLSVALGPGMLGHIFDGLLRPLGDVTEHWFKPGLAAKRTGSFDFTPHVAAGDELAGGALFGKVAGNGPGRGCLVPPNVSGRVVSIEPAGAYPEDAPLLVLEDAKGRKHTLSMQHDWPVRKPRPAAGRLPADAPMVTGQRILDTLFPVARGGRAALPGGFGTGKTVLQESLAKWCDADIIIYVGCGERGNEMAEVLDEFPPARGPAHRPQADGAHGHHRQHLEHAGGGARGVDLHRHHGGGILP
jgi:V/A-type H+/Na+-transporting ATPase subunit A